LNARKQSLFFDVKTGADKGLPYEVHRGTSLDARRG
jgi:hypothetical protein